jgi:hypothetical protein
VPPTNQDTEGACHSAPNGPKSSLANAGPASSEPALTYRLPENPDIELLNRARTEVLIYLDFVTNDGAQCEDVSADINPAALDPAHVAQRCRRSMPARSRPYQRASTVGMKTKTSPIGG